MQLLLDQIEQGVRPALLKHIAEEQVLTDTQVTNDAVTDKRHPTHARTISHMTWAWAGEIDRGYAVGNGSLLT
jgi:hypothetical protein